MLDVSSFLLLKAIINEAPNKSLAVVIVAGDNYILTI